VLFYTASEGRQLFNSCPLCLARAMHKASARCQRRDQQITAALLIVLPLSKLSMARQRFSVWCNATTVMHPLLLLHPLAVLSFCEISFISCWRWALEWKASRCGSLCTLTRST
jgi:hypothetical protein